MCHPPLIVLTASMPASIVPQPPLVHYNSHSTYCEDDDVCSDCSSSTATEDENIATSKPPSCCCSCCSTAKPASPSYTLCQIRSHCTFDSAWLVAGKDVYDATAYLHSHPGGVQSILKYAGGKKDVTQDLLFHSKQARKMWTRYKIGTVVPCPHDEFGMLKTHQQIEESNESFCTIS
mmetsp:Transcript_26330/g.37736  ORF Transcript_26330/g.37736 Transcript_26330/m.37736 type:complete len:177 (-) Transcript_26330:1176-1706(-)